MPVCQFFLQGRCKFGDDCWNEHSREGGRGGGGGGGYNSNNRGPPPQQNRGGGGFGNKVWVNPSQQRGGYVQPSSFGSRNNDQWSRRDGGGGGSDWGRGGGGGGGGSFGRRENIKSSEFGFSQNRFSALDTPSTFDKGRRAATTTRGDEDNSRICETIQSDMEVWESSGQWGFSTYSHAKNPLSGFSDLSPEELRLEYYTSRASGNLQNYINGINQLLSQWRSRVRELKVMNASTRAALITELNSTVSQESSTGFGSTDTGSLSTFSFPGAPATGFGSPSVLPSTGFGSASSAPPTSGFAGAPTAPPPPGFGGAPTAPPPTGFGATSPPTASSFSFAASDKTSNAAPSGFGSASGFSFSAGTGGGFGTGFGATATTTSTFGSTSAFGQPSTSVPAPAVPASGATDSLFSTESSLTSEELNQFKAKRFTLGQIPLKPPPANLLVV
uniref:Nucleoporin NUP42 n=1 Tax=Periophthalmus magnuspinnatus TaxID=409849 RepID=A0A3B4B205_9GOBI